MGNYVASNNASSTLSGAITSSATTLSLQVSDIAKFPVVNNGGIGSDYSYLTLQDNANNIEIVKVTRHDSGSPTFTVSRAQEGTTAHPWSAGDAIACRLTASVVNDSFVAASSVGASAAAAALSAQNAFTSASNAISTANEASGKASSAASAALHAQESADSALSGSAFDSEARNLINAAQITANNLIRPGMMMRWPLPVPPPGWFMRNGAEVSRLAYPALYGVIGTIFGVGDGLTTYNLPDDRDRMSIGAGGAYLAGATGGSADAIVPAHTHTASTQITDPGHFHSTFVQTQTGGTSSGPDANWWRTDASTTGTAATGISASTAVNSTGSSRSNANLPPYLADYGIIKY